MEWTEREPSVRRWRVLGTAGVPALALVVDLVLWNFDNTTGTGDGVPVVPVALVVATAVPVFGLLCFRNLHARLAFVLAWVYTLFWGALIPQYQPLTALLVALHAIARQLPIRHAIWFLLVAAVPVIGNTVDAVGILHSDAADTLQTAAIWFVIVATVWTAGRWSRRSAEAARWREEKLAAEAALTLQDERLSIARELHDTVSNSVSSIIFQAAGARRLAERDHTVALRSLELIEACGVRATDELHDLLGILSTASAPAGARPRSAGHRGLVDLAELVEHIRAGGTVVELHRRGEPRRLDAHADHTAYRVVQESLTNAIKHSGRDLRVDIALDWLRDSVQLTVLSSSSGERVAPSTGSGGYGLAGMRQRVADVGGVLESGWRSPGRFWVSARVPVSGSERADRTQATEVARR